MLITLVRKATSLHLYTNASRGLSATAEFLVFPSGGRNYHQYSLRACVYPRRDGQAELAWVAGYIMRQFICPKVPERISHPSHY